MNDDVTPPAAGEPIRVPGGYFVPASAKQPTAAGHSDEISLSELRQALASSWKLIALSTVLCTVIAIAISFALTPTFRAELLIAPAESNDADAGSRFGGSLTNQLGALASFAGIGASSTTKEEAIAVLKSRLISDNLVKDKNLLPILFPKKWDADNNRWKSTDPKEIPTLWDSYKVMKTIFTVAEDKKTGLIVAAVEWKDPKIAAEWVNDLVLRTNLYMRSKAIAHSTANIDYLQAELVKTSVVEIKTSMNSLIEQEFKKIMLAQGSEEYAFKIVDPVVVPQEKSFPKRSMFAIGGLVIGLFAGILMAFTRRQSAIDDSLRR